jgi:hypothetical protein
MSKSFRRFNTKKEPRSYDDHEEDHNSRTSSYSRKKIDRNINNAIRSKNVNRLLELHNDDEDL